LFFIVASGHETICARTATSQSNSLDAADVNFCASEFFIYVLMPVD